MTEPARKPEPAAKQADLPVVAVAKAPARLPPSARDMRRARGRKLAIRYLVFVGLPTLLSIVYYAALATPQYDAQAVVAVEARDDEIAPAGGKGDVTGHQRDARLVADYVTARTMLTELDASHGIVAHYQGSDIDWWARLDGDAGGDETYQYYRDKVVANVDPQSSAVSLRVRAFSPARAQELVAAIVESATGWIERRSARARSEQLEPAEQEVAQARERLVVARTAMLAVTGGAEPRPDQRAEPAVMEHELSELAMAGALESLQQARVEAARAQRYLIVIDSPSQPDQASKPRLLWDVATVLISSLVLVSVLSLLGAAVREHANF